MNTIKTNLIIKKNADLKPEHRNEYNKFVKKYTVIVRNKYELMPRKQQRMLVLEMWEKRKEINSKIYNLCPSVKTEEFEHIAKILEEMEKEEW